jgi:hypothetical protein
VSTPRPAQTLQQGLVDDDDEWVLASAVLAIAELFVTGDQGVLACTNPPLPVLSPRCCREPLCASQLNSAASNSPGAAPPMIGVRMELEPPELKDIWADW